VSSGNIIPPKAQMVMARDFVVRRSELTVPGHSMKMMAKAAASNADQVMLDLEDACAVSQKVEARKTVVEALNTLDFTGKIRAFRPNNIRTRIRTQCSHFKLCNLSLKEGYLCA
jgi:citrate lyase subunit beta / citryl-CoA lyase